MCAFKKDILHGPIDSFAEESGTERLVCLGRYIPIWFIFQIPLNFLFSIFFRYYANLLTQKPDRDDADSAIEGANHNIKILILYL